MAGNSEEHELIDALSRSRGDQDDDEKFSPIDPKDAQKLYNMLTLPPNYEIDKPMLKRLLENDGLPALNDKKKKKPSKKVISSDKAIKVDILKERSINLPRLTNIYPDYSKQKAQLNINPPEYSKDDEPTEPLSNRGNEPEVFESIQEILVRDNSQTASSQDEGESEGSVTSSSSESIFSEDFDEYEYDLLNEERIQAFIFEDGLISTETMKYAQNTDPKICCKEKRSISP